jgi:ribonuclease P protein component
MSKIYTFTKEERLCNKKLIDELFRNGSSFLVYPFKVSWLVAAEPQLCPAQVLFSVPKKRYKHAVDRNLLKRRMREAYRLNKEQYLYQALKDMDKQIVFSIGYVGKEIADYAFIERKMVKLLNSLAQPHAK